MKMTRHAKIKEIIDNNKIETQEDLASASMVVIRTLPGTAQAVAFAVDYMKWPEILGSIAGDDTVFIALPNKEAVITLLERFKNYR